MNIDAYKSLDIKERAWADLLEKLLREVSVLGEHIQALTDAINDGESVK